jgi:hypothetical protein
MDLLHTSATRFTRKFSFTVCRTMPLIIFICSGNFFVGTSLALAFWSYLPLYVLPIAIGACVSKVSIEVCDRHQRPRPKSCTHERILQERTIEQDPELGHKYKAYKCRVPYRIIPYIW